MRHFHFPFYTLFFIWQVILDHGQDVPHPLTLSISNLIRLGDLWKLTSNSRSFVLKLAVIWQFILPTSLTKVLLFRFAHNSIQKGALFSCRGRFSIPDWFWIDQRRKPFCLSINQPVRWQVRDVTTQIRLRTCQHTGCHVMSTTSQKRSGGWKTLACALFGVRGLPRSHQRSLRWVS